ncbi:MAG TPA: sigma-70 family RNA polymerase sigma factor, partial [Candidatus Baltobacteraceae bacterium]|nr:sigma-70 family RNA polymerase sigma factor [Candidatus Baltobacteraceae bacterium]
MADASDIELLRNYARQNAEDAFAELVRRHINLVYSTALRHAGIAAQAEEITQAVFIILAHKAANLRPDTVLEAWLYETTRLTALSFLRGERRRQQREQEAYMQSTFDESHAVQWSQLAPLLDEAMSRLNRKDREAILLRFFKEKKLNEVATALSITEAAAQSRVLRAVEKLQKFFFKRGVTSTSKALTETISANSIQAAPAALIKATTAIALAKGATASLSTLTLIKGALKIMAWSKAKIAVIAGSIVLLVVGTGGVAIIKYHKDMPSTDEGIPPFTAEGFASSEFHQSPFDT